MTVCIDTIVIVQMFGRGAVYYPILEALRNGKMALAVSPEILLEYREIVSQLGGARRWTEFAGVISALSAVHSNIREVNPQFRFSVITTDPDDNKFVDCAVAAEADYIVTSDRHFDVLRGSGYKPQPIDPLLFIKTCLTAQN